MPSHFLSRFVLFDHQTEGKIYVIDKVLAWLHWLHWLYDYTYHFDVSMQSVIPHHARVFTCEFFTISTVGDAFDILEFCLIL